MVAKGCGHAPGAWVVARSGVATCCRCGVRRFTAYAALWREVPGRAVSGPTASASGTGVLRARRDGGGGGGEGVGRSLVAGASPLPVGRAALRSAGGGRTTR
ncbi:MULTISPECIES: DUF6255 family natural product biosynthesis protein [Streptomyces]|uniref:DUF6255 family natural product biosynthesis protein n=1 Tax=Streptomyces TaxID=1883 RepID=UPI001CCE42A2|nr:hypothetical protein K7I03_21430 [Streptomyces mobaraensis]